MNQSHKFSHYFRYGLISIVLVVVNALNQTQSIPLTTSDQVLFLTTSNTVSSFSPSLVRSLGKMTPSSVYDFRSFLNPQETQIRQIVQGSDGQTIYALEWYDFAGNNLYNSPQKGRFTRTNVVTGERNILIDGLILWQFTISPDGESAFLTYFKGDYNNSLLEACILKLASGNCKPTNLELLMGQLGAWVDNHTYVISGTAETQATIHLFDTKRLFIKSRITGKSSDHETNHRRINESLTDFG